jgi:hypothetical protein
MDHVMNRDALIGLLAAGIAGYELFCAIVRGYVHGRFRIRIHRTTRPNLFWFNVVVYAVIGVFSVIWAASHAS